MAIETLNTLNEIHLDVGTYIYNL